MDGITTDDHVTIAPAQATTDSGRYHVIASSPRRARQRHDGAQTTATPASSASPSPRRQAAGGANRQHGQRLATVTASSSRPRPRAPSPPTATARSSLSSGHHGADRRPIADGIPSSRHVSTIDQRQACHPVTKKGGHPPFSCERRERRHAASAMCWSSPMSRTALRPISGTRSTTSDRPLPEAALPGLYLGACP
jgi:hypothetical protein